MSQPRTPDPRLPSSDHPIPMPPPEPGDRPFPPLGDPIPPQGPAADIVPPFDVPKPDKTIHDPTPPFTR